MRILVINSGSSSIKYQLFESEGWQALATGAVSRIGEAEGELEQHWTDASGEGQSLQEARRFADQLDIMDLPFEPLSRTISLTARKGILQDMPGQVAQTLKPILRKTVVEPAIAAHPFLKERLRLYE